VLCGCYGNGGVKQESDTQGLGCRFLLRRSGATCCRPRASSQILDLVLPNQAPDDRDPVLFLRLSREGLRSSTQQSAHTEQAATGTDLTANHQEPASGIALPRRRRRQTNRRNRTLRRPSIAPGPRGPRLREESRSLPTANHCTLVGLQLWLAPRRGSYATAAAG
jgi:hypothetical protein